MADDNEDIAKDTATGAGTGAMVGGPWGAVIGGGLGLAGGLMGQGSAKSGQAQQAQAIQDALAAMRNVALPTDIANRIYNQQYQTAGQLSPQQEAIINASPSIAGQTKGNQNLQAAQLQALNALKNISQTGMSSVDRARLNQIQQQAATQAEGQKQAVMQNFAQRGQGGSGNELLAQLQASQNASNQANQAGLGVAANAQQNALSALGQYGQQAGQMEGQQFGQQMQAGTAQDLLNRFNTQNQLTQQARNVGSQNAAQQYNLQNQQNIMNANTGQTNQEMVRQKQAQQQLFQDALQRAGGMYAGNMAAGAAANEAGQSAAKGWQSIGQGAGQMFNAANNLNYGGGGNSNSFSNDVSSLDDYGDLMNANKAQTGPVQQNGSFSHGGVVPGYNQGGEASCYSFGGHVPKSEDQYVRTYGNGFDAPNNYAHGGMTPMISALMRHGGHVPGQASVPNDSLENDKVHALLSPGEIVIPRSITMHPDAPALAKDFVSLELRKKHQR